MSSPSLPGPLPLSSLLCSVARYVQRKRGATGSLLVADDDGSGRLVALYEREGWRRLGGGADEEMGGLTMFRDLRGDGGGLSWVGELEVRFEGAG